jgi:hypothetical protein
MERTIWIVIAAGALVAAGFFGYRAYDVSRGQADEKAQQDQMKRDLDAANLAASEAAKKAAQETEARRLAEAKANEEAEAEARRLAQAQNEREAQEAARKRAEEEAAKAAAEIERIRGEKAALAAEAQRLTEARAREAADAQAKLAAAQRALEESELRKNAEIERQAALIASYNRAPNKVEKPTPEETQRQSSTRVIFPSDYKRANHYYLPLLPTATKDETK